MVKELFDSLERLEHGGSRGSKFDIHPFSVGVINSSLELAECLPCSSPVYSTSFALYGAVLGYIYILLLESVFETRCDL